MKVLVIEDDPDTVYLVSTCLKLRWPQTEVLESRTGRGGVELAGDAAPDFVILDIGLPDIDGLTVLREIRGFSDVPVIMLTGRGQDLDIAASLEGGADDYVRKPFSAVELIARLQAVTRRAGGRPQPTNPVLTTGDLVLDFGAAEVYKDGEPINLTPSERTILEDLTRNALRVVNYRSLASSVFGVDDPSPLETQTLRVHVQHLRSKLGAPADNPKLIANVRGAGYKFMVPVTPLAAKTQE